ncbi:RelA/SpoT family protein [Nostocoides jenkinsii]|uniref:GTP pyrophosphokinase (RelA/SpoT) n=1 Tax=Nostocoides jenkinsii Ben 74 TaxID=1193518 RepID=A0A077ME05_9MICO|nr:bifunctional (p)ppGpp synthetase/guanosine-3',5'-bis(diphosphate) 3'-pyrophosphohydrolase [Tetrasphaera jenkinsii]CCI53177.1 GTP pyrophosphokinase (RelA/SpoT) [Tetrasphaera jenkinsii Ben 74]
MKEEAAPGGPTSGAPVPPSTSNTTARGRAFARLEWISRPRAAAHDPILDPLISLLRQNHPRADVSILQRAYVVAEEAHRGQMRKSGDPYITHPLAVAMILAELGMTPVTLAAALLHDVVEDTDIPLSDIERDFGAEVAHMVNGVTKLDKVQYGELAAAETVRKMIVAMAGDIRVLVIKLADRLHNARTFGSVSLDSASRKATETLDIFAPLAHRLGMNTVKWELEDIAFRTLYPKVFEEIRRQVSERAGERAEYLHTVQSQVEADLAEAKIKATVSGRPKHYYSIYQKMVAGHRDFDDIHDLVGVRVLVESQKDCYAALGAVHARWKPIGGRFKDYIAIPKFNMYQSLHTTVIGPSGRPVEVQIRTHAMHRRAEYGVAAHWKYKEDRGGSGKGSGADDPLDINDMAWLRQLIDWQRETEGPTEFLESLRYEMSAREVYTFTPKGDVITLPNGSTSIDFAYAVHTEVGHRCVGARVNGRLVSLESRLDNGDVVEILTSKAEGAGPSHDWINIVVSPRARNKIRQWFSKSRREEAVEAGTDAIAKAMRKQHLPLQRMMSHQMLAAVAAELRYADVDALYAAVGDNHVSAASVVARLVNAVGGDEGAKEDVAESVRVGRPARRRSGEPGISVAGMGREVFVKLAKCCTPVPGDEILGFVTRGAGVSVHRSDCTNATSLRSHPERLVEVSWDLGPGTLFRVHIEVLALDREGLLSDITRVLADNGVNILGANVSTNKDRFAVLHFQFEMGDSTHLDHVTKAVKKVIGVFEIKRGGSATGD